ncbi:class I SAM-dependent methyltransferase [Candidatus Pacearchaeota archaeon]|nr:class I SAM-dependent methyltransferase [Candidatus Pacearchaeota archaeon]
MNLLKKCEICGEKSFEFLFKGKDKLLNIPGEFYLVKCKKCGVICINPQPSYKELEKYYSPDKYYSLKGVDKSSRKTKLKLFLYDLYFNKKNRNYLLKLVFLPIKFMIRGTIIKKGKRLLDIGSGSGQFLYEMKQFGLDVYGVETGEFNEKSVKKEKLNIQKTTLEKVKYKEDFFDAITMNHVLEHVNNPNETLKEIHKILKKKGLFIVAVPNYNSLAYKIFKSDWLALDVPRHLFNYSDKILKKLLEQEKFKIVKVRYNSRPSQFAVSLEYFLEKRFGKFIKAFLTMVFLPLTWIVNLIKQGDQIEVWCVRKIKNFSVKNI